MILILLSIIILDTKYAVNLFSDKNHLHVDINKIIILGGFALSLGIFSHYLGIYQGLQMFSYMSTEQVAGGYATSLVALMLGMGIFVLSGILWFALRSRLNALLAKA